jgi:hypothetical protein
LSGDPISPDQELKPQRHETVGQDEQDLQDALATVKQENRASNIERPTPNTE